jgi:hypothetical protein
MPSESQQTAKTSSMSRDKRMSDFECDKVIRTPCQCKKACNRLFSMTYVQAIRRVIWRPSVKHADQNHRIIEVLSRNAVTTIAEDGREVVRLRYKTAAFIDMIHETSRNCGDAESPSDMLKAPVHIVHEEVRAFTIRIQRANCAVGRGVADPGCLSFS